MSSTISVDDQSSQQQFIFPLSIQTAVENAIKHNAFSESDPLTIEIKQEKASVVIKNDLKEKIQGAPSTGIGIKNLIQRYLPYGLTPEFYKTKDHYIARLPIIFSNREEIES